MLFTLFMVMNVLVWNNLLSSNMGGYLHFSIDDSNSVFEDLNSTQYSSIFEQPKLGFLKKLHDQYGVVVSFYTYYSWDVEKNEFDLSMMTDRYHEEFSKNSDWLRFGFHAKDADAYENCSPEKNLEYYNKTIAELLRITGSVECIDNFVRLDRYQADTETVKLLQSADNGIVGLLAADDPNRQSYALSVTEMLDMNTNDWFEDESGVCIHQRIFA